MTTAQAPGPLDRTFTASLEKSDAKGGWTYVKLDGSAEYFAPVGWSRSPALSTVSPSPALFMALGDGTHKLPIAAGLRRTIGKSAGDTVTVHLQQRLS